MVLRCSKCRFDIEPGSPVYCEGCFSLVCEKLVEVKGEADRLRDEVKRLKDEIEIMKLEGRWGKKKWKVRRSGSRFP